MAISNYGELKTAVANWLNRDDLTSRIPEFIEIARANINRDLRGVRERLDLTIDAQIVAVAETVGDIYSIALDGVGPLAAVTPDRIQYQLSLWADTTGRPQYFAFTPGIAGGGSLSVSPAPDQDYTAKVVYQPQLAAFSADADTNDVLTNHLDIYLNAALVAATPFLKDDQRIPVWDGAYTKAIEGLRQSMMRRQYPGTPIARPRRPLGE